MTTSTLSKSWYLIQRCSESDPDRSRIKTGVDRILQFDYMGAAEFEFGALSRTFKTFRELGVAGKLIAFKFNLIGTISNPDWRAVNKYIAVDKTIYVLAKEGLNETEIAERILAIAKDESRLKEASYMDRALAGYKGFDDDICAWVNIESGYSGFDPVLWSTRKDLISRLLAELKREQATPVDPAPEPKVDPLAVKDGSEISMFDPIHVNHEKYKGIGVVCGIYERTLDIKRPDGIKVKGLPFQSARRLG